MKSVTFSSLQNLVKQEGGLKNSEVVSQRTKHGSNIIVEVAGNPWLELIAETAKDPMIWFLVGIGAVFFTTGQITDGITLFVAVLPLLLMDAFLHWRTQSSTATLKGNLNSKVRVFREDQQVEIDSRELVPGDVVILSPGLLLPADGYIEAAENIQIDESVLTGEALPIIKKEISVNPFELVDREEVKVAPEMIAYAGTRVLTGMGRLRVMLTGSKTSYGEIVQSVSRMPHERTPLQKSISQLVKILIFIAFVFCLILAAVRVYQGHGWLDALLSAATLAIAAIPEEFPVVFTFFLGVGIYRLAKKKALVRRAVSVENIGRVTQICTDKTGTITVGHLQLTHLDPAQGVSEDDLLWDALIASSSEMDPLDLAIHEAFRDKRKALPARFKTIPFTEDRKREVGFLKQPDGTFVVCVKGAPETVLAISELSEDEKQAWLLRVSNWAKSGHKVIAIAKKVSSLELIDDPQGGLLFEGLFAFEDPPRPEVAEAMGYCRKNGIRVLMITGDHPETAAAIAFEAGLTPNPPVVVSAENQPEKFQEAWLKEHPDDLKKVDVVARCSPLQKLRIVNSLKNSGELVAVTGDGVNDVPALKAADIGIAMGERGTRSAKEVSSIILADDHFNTIINAIREGRQLFSNLKMSFEYLLLIHIPLVLTAAFIPLAALPIAYLPVHIVWLELMIHPTALLAFQASVSDQHEHLNQQKSFFTRGQVVAICVVGCLVSLALGLNFFSALNDHGEPLYARAKAMAALSVWSAGISLYLTRLKSTSANLISSMIVLSSILLIQFSETIQFLHLSPLFLKDWGLIGVSVLFFIGLFHSLKLFFSRTTNHFVK